MVEYNQAAPAQFVQGFGGDVSNFAIAAARQGARAGVISALGDDEPGRQLRTLWAAEGVDASLVRCDATAATGIYFVHHDARGHHFSFWRSGSAASRITPQMLDEAATAAAIAAARCLHFSGITLAISNSACDTAFEAAAMARASGVLVSFDTNLRRQLWPLPRARALILEAMRQCDICLPSLEDVRALGGQEFGQQTPDAIVDHALTLGARVVGLKLGAQGALVASASERHHIATFPCTALDATGAGDTFGGAFVARWLAGDGLRAAGTYAAAAAALSTEGYGAVAPIPHAAAVRELLIRTQR